MKQHLGWAFPDVDEFMVGQLKPGGRYQETHLERALVYVRDWTLAVDGGAHVGTWSRLLADRFDRVIACEPSADTYEALRANMAAFSCANVEARQVALGETNGAVTMVLDGRGAVLKNTGARHVATGTDVPLETIDSWHLPTLGFLKLDVEGSEPFALRGAEQTLRRCKPVVLFEDKGLWVPYGVERRGPQAWLESIGYREIERIGCDVIWRAQ